MGQKNSMWTRGKGDTDIMSHRQKACLLQPTLRFAKLLCQHLRGQKVSSALLPAACFQTECSRICMTVKAFKAFEGHSVLYVALLLKLGVDGW